MYPPKLYFSYLLRAFCANLKFYNLISFVDTVFFFYIDLNLISYFLFS